MRFLSTTAFFYHGLQFQLGLLFPGLFTLSGSLEPCQNLLTCSFRICHRHCHIFGSFFAGKDTTNSRNLQVLSRKSYYGRGPKCPSASQRSQTEGLRMRYFVVSISQRAKFTSPCSLSIRKKCDSSISVLCMPYGFGANT